jgi:hypothetical protein
MLDRREARKRKNVLFLNIGNKNFKVECFIKLSRAPKKRKEIPA